MGSKEKGMRKNGRKGHVQVLYLFHVDVMESKRLEWVILSYLTHYIPPPPYPNFTTFLPNPHMQTLHLSDLFGIPAVPARLVQG